MSIEPTGKPSINIKDIVIPEVRPCPDVAGELARWHRQITEQSRRIASPSRKRAIDDSQIQSAFARSLTVAVHATRPEEEFDALWAAHFVATARSHDIEITIAHALAQARIEDENGKRRFLRKTRDALSRENLSLSELSFLEEIPPLPIVRCF